MIVDHIRNRHLYYGLGARYQQALEYLAAYKPGAQERRDDVLDGENLFVRIRPMQTKPIEECSLEAHRFYADIHYVAKGSERIGYADILKLTCESYNEEKDAGVLTGECDLITLEEGYFMITGKNDAHMPCVMKNSPAFLEKLIVKVKL